MYGWSANEISVDPELHFANIPARRATTSNGLIRVFTIGTDVSVGWVDASERKVIAREVYLQSLCVFKVFRTDPEVLTREVPMFFNNTESNHLSILIGYVRGGAQCRQIRS